MPMDPMGRYRDAPVPTTLEEPELLPDTPIGPKPDGGYIYDAVPQSLAQAKAATAEARVRQVTKSAVSAYVQTYFTQGTNRNRQIQLTAPFGGQFITDVSGGANRSDPTIIDLQIARLYTSLRQRFPCCLVIDTSYQYKFSGAFGMEASRRVPLPYGHSRQFTTSQKMIVNVGIQVMMAALSESEASDLGDVLHLVLGTLTHTNRAHILTSGKPEDRWEVRLPLTMSGTMLERHPIQDDQRDSIWSTSIELETVFEGEVQLGFNDPTATLMVAPGDGPVTGVPESPGLRVIAQHQFGCGAAANEALAMRVTVPEIMNLREFPRVQIENAPGGITVRSDNPRVAYVDSAGIIHPKAPGSFNLLILKDVGVHYEPVVLYTKTLQVRI